MITTMSSDIANEISDIRFIELRLTGSTADFTQVGTETFRYLNVRQEIFNDIPEEKKPLDWRHGIIGVLIPLIQRRKRRRFNNYG
jgi:hypothetical protein